MTTKDYDKMNREELFEEVKERKIPYKGQPGEERLREMLVEDDAGSLTKIVLPGGLTIDDISSEFDSDVSVEEFGKRAKNPFNGYPVRLLTARRYPRNPLLDRMGRSELLDYCARNEFFSRNWNVRRDTNMKDKDQHPKVVEIDTGADWDDERIRRFIDSKQTFSIPLHHLVFTRIPPTKPTVPHIIALKSWITKRHQAIWFDLSWPLPTPDNPYFDGGRPFQGAIVDDDSMRAQLFFTRQHVTGKVIPRKIGSDSKVDAYFMLREEQRKSIGLLERIYRAGTQGSSALDKWSKLPGGLPEVPDSRS